MRSSANTSWQTFQALEDEKRRLILGLNTGDRPLLFKAHNDLDTAAAVRAALGLEKSAGLIDETVLAQLQETGDTRAFCGGDILCLDTEVPGPNLLCFTSGSTGSAKGILRSADSWTHTYEVQRQTLNHGMNASVLIFGSIAHSLHFYGAMEALDRGVVPTILASFTPKQVLDVCARDRPEILYATPSHLGLILAQAKTYRRAPLDSVRMILTGGAKFNERNLRPLGDLFPSAAVVEFFGTTETSYMTIKQPNAPSGSVGKPCKGVDIQVRAADGRLLPPRQEGALWVKSNMLFSRYIIGEDPQTRWRDGYLTIGDQGFLDEAGNLYFTSREGSMVTIAGESVYLDHIERSLTRFISKGEAIVVPIADELRGNHLVAMTQFELPQDQRDEALNAMRAEFGTVKSPKSILHAPEWPFLPSGKVDRQRLVEIAAGFTVGKV